MGVEWPLRRVGGSGRLQRNVPRGPKAAHWPCSLPFSCSQKSPGSASRAAGAKTAARLQGDSEPKSPRQRERDRAIERDPCLCH